MFCANCGKSVDKKLKYCNACGQRLGRENDENTDSPARMLDDILDTLFWTAVLTLGILIGLVAVLLANNVKSEIFASIVFIYLATVFGICFMLARQIPKLIDARLKAFSTGSEDKQDKQISNTSTPQLREYREPVLSVTDHTTRTLEKVPFGES